MCNFFTGEHILLKLKVSVIKGLHTALYHMQKQLKSSETKQFYKHFPQIYQTALVYFNKEKINI